MKLWLDSINTCWAACLAAARQVPLCASPAMKQGNMFVNAADFRVSTGTNYWQSIDHSVCHSCRYRSRSQVQAVKIFSKALLKKRRLGQQSDKFAALQSEIAIMRRLRHPNVIQLHEVIDDPSRDELFVGASCAGSLVCFFCLPMVF